MGDRAKVGDRVFFKEDIEGSGIVRKVECHRNWLGEVVRTYYVCSESEPNGYPFHIMARWCAAVNAMAVVTDRVWIA